MANDKKTGNKNETATASKRKKLVVEKLAVGTRAGLASEFLIVGCVSITIGGGGSPNIAAAAAPGPKAGPKKAGAK